MEKFISDPCSKSWFVGVSSIYTLYPSIDLLQYKPVMRTFCSSVDEGITKSGGSQITVHCMPKCTFLYNIVVHLSTEFYVCLIWMYSALLLWMTESSLFYRRVWELLSPLSVFREQELSAFTAHACPWSTAELVYAEADRFPQASRLSMDQLNNLIFPHSWIWPILQ